MAFGGRVLALVVLASAVLGASTATASSSLNVGGLKTNGVRALRRENGTWIAEIGSGSYDFLVASSERELVRARTGAQV